MYLHPKSLLYNQRLLFNHSNCHFRETGIHFISTRFLPIFLPAEYSMNHFEQNINRTCGDFDQLSRNVNFTEKMGYHGYVITYHFGSKILVNILT